MKQLTDFSFHVYQKADDDNCGPTCLAMIYRLKQVKRSVNDILSDANIEKKGEPTYAPQLARDLLAHHIRTQILSMNTRSLPPSWSEYSSKELQASLKKWLVHNKNHEWFLHNLHMLFYLQEGGSVKIKVFSIQDIEQMIDNGSILLVCVDEVWLYGSRSKAKEATFDNIRGDTYGHFVLITGYTETGFQIADPYPTGDKKKNKVYIIPKEHLIAASFSWAGSIVEVLK